MKNFPRVRAKTDLGFVDEGGRSGSHLSRPTSVEKQEYMKSVNDAINAVNSLRRIVRPAWP